MAFDKKYIAKDKEKQIREFWEKEQIFKFDEKTKKPIFSIDTPPPTVSGKMHIGHAYSYSQQDMIARFKRMEGNEIFYPFGTDDNGLPTEKLVQKSEKINLRNVSREEAVNACVKFLSKERPNFIQDWKNIGMSCDFDLKYSTIDKHSQKISQKTFIDLYKKDLIEQKEGPISWDRVFQTAIAQAELEDKTRKAFLNYTKAKIVGTENTYVIYATTRPELLYAVVGMSVEDSGEYVKLKIGNEYWITGAATYEEKFSNFEFEVVEKLKGKNLIGEKALIPFVEKEIEISHDMAVKADFGTGIAYFCSYGGLEDIEWVARHNATPIELLDKAGKLNEKGGEYSGMLAEDARKEIIKDLEEKGHIIFKEEKEQVVNVGERSGAEVEFIVSKQWYVKYLDKKEHFWEMAQKFNWFPEFMKHRLENWIKGLNWNWGFSRQRHFGIPIPVWHDKKGNIYLPDEDQLPIDPLKDKPKSAPKNVELIPETDVFDTWFTSASTPFLAIELVKDEKVKKKLFPMSMRPQAHDIISFWLFYTMAKTNLLTEENPFKDILISGWVLASDGTKMSKSKGNTISPQEMIEKYSGDAIRFGAAGTKLGHDIPFQEKELQSGIRVVNKLFNANKFASMLLETFTKKDKEFKLEDLNSIDKWIISKTQKVSKEARIALENYDYAKAKALFDHLFMGDIADNYIEIVKQRLWKPEEFGELETKKAQKALYHSLYASLRGLAPFLVYITEEIYQNFYKQFESEKSIHLTKYPEFNSKLYSEENINLGDKFIEIVSQVRRFKAEKQMSMKEEIKKLEITCDKKLKEFIENSIKDLKAVTSFVEINFKTGEFNIKISN